MMYCVYWTGCLKSGRLLIPVISSIIMKSALFMTISSGGKLDEDFVEIGGQINGPPKTEFGCEFKSVHNCL